MGQAISTTADGLADEIASSTAPDTYTGSGRRPISSSRGVQWEDDDGNGSFRSCFSDEETGGSRSGYSSRGYGRRNSFSFIRRGSLRKQDPPGIDSAGGGGESGYTPATSYRGKPSPPAAHDLRLSTGKPSDDYDQDHPEQESTSGSSTNDGARGGGGGAGNAVSEQAVRLLTDLTTLLKGNNGAAVSLPPITIDSSPAINLNKNNLSSNKPISTNLNEKTNITGDDSSSSSSSSDSTDHNVKRKSVIGGNQKGLKFVDDDGDSLDSTTHHDESFRNDSFRADSFRVEIDNPALFGDGKEEMKDNSMPNESAHSTMTARFQREMEALKAGKDPSEMKLNKKKNSLDISSEHSDSSHSNKKPPVSALRSGKYGGGAGKPVTVENGSQERPRPKTLVSMKLQPMMEEDDESVEAPIPMGGGKKRRGTMANLKRGLGQSMRHLMGKKKEPKKKEGIQRNFNRQSIATFNPDKKKNRIFRWNLLWTFLVFGTIFGLGLAPLWMDKIWGCQQSWYFTASIFTAMDIIFLVSALLAWPNLFREIWEFLGTSNEYRYLSKTNLTPTGEHINKNLLDCPINFETGLPQITHLVMMTGYKEPVDLICATIDTVACQTRAKNIIMVIGWEERTPEFDEKIAFFENRYGNSFFRLVQTVHPYGLPGEIAGTCSNANWAVRQSTTMLRDEGTPLDPETTLLTKLDTDTMFLPTHFDVLEREFKKLPKELRLNTMYQSVLCFNLSLDERWFFTRVTGILRSFFILGFLVPYNISAMSIYSMPLSLARRGNYWLPHYQMEDVIQNLNLMSCLGRRVPIQLIPLPTISGPTSGETFFKEFYEWRWQARRWTVGSAEVFHYYMVKFLGGNIPLMAGINYGLCYMLYYGMILCVIGLYQFTASIAVLFDTCDQDQNSLLWPILMGLKYVVVFGTAFSADFVHRQIIGVQERALTGLWGWIRSIFHWISSPWVLLGYNIVEAVAILELTYYGRDICGHDASEKTALVSGDDKDKLPELS